MKRILSNSLCGLLCLFYCLNLNAQFKNKAALQPVTKTGFYSIAITPELSSYLKTDFSDLRILDDQGRQAVYLVNVDVPSLGNTQFFPLKIISYQLADSNKSTLLIENTGKRKIKNFSLIIKNNAVNRRANVSGGEDLKNWFTIAENLDLEKSYVNDTDRYVENIIFPNSMYRYYKVVIYNGKNDPLNIVSAGLFSLLANLNTPSRYTVNPTTGFKQTDSSDDFSYLHVKSELPFQISRIHLKVSGPKFFKREVDVITQQRQPYNFTISSDTTFYFAVPSFKNKEWLVKIFNGDNPPLIIKKIETEQDGHKIICWLDSGKTYHLEMNDINARAPQYDLQSFKDSIPAAITSLGYIAIEPLVPDKSNTNKTFFTSSWLWIVIVSLLVGLLYFTWSLTREIRNKTAG